MTELKEMSDLIAETDEEIRIVKSNISGLKSKRKALKDKRKRLVFQLQDKIDEKAK